MGHYTQFGGTIKLKPEHVATIEKLIDGIVDELESLRPWNCWNVLTPEYPQLQSFADLYDAHMIPFGSGQAGDPCFQELTPGGEFVFACSLKNRGDVIGEFMKQVLPLIADRAQLYSQYCEFDTPDKYEFEDGVLTQTEVGIYTL